MSRPRLNPGQRIIIHSSATEVQHDPIDSVRYEDFHIEYFSGIAIGDLGTLNSDLSDPIQGEFSIGDIADSYGEWYAVAQSGGAHDRTFLVLGDFYGFSPIFYSLLPGEAVVLSNSFSGVINELKLRGVEPRFDVGTYSATVSNSMNLFQFPFGDATMSEHVKLLPFGTALQISMDSVSIVNRENISRSIAGSSIHELVDTGLRTMDHALNLLSSDTSNDLVINLSGGVDSRLVLAAILSKNLQDKTKIRTKDPRDYNGYSRDVFERDAEIAATLVGDKNLAWFNDPEIREIPTDFNTALAFHQSYNSNYYFEFSPTSSLEAFESPVVTLLGGGGEILRTPNGPIVLAQKLQSQSIGIGSIGDWVANQTELPDVLKEKASHRIQSSIDLSTGETLAERLVNQYLRSRNRTHFGQARAWSAGNNLPIQLLANPYFYQAAKKLTFDERRNGKLVRTLFHYLDKSLLSYPFEDESATQILCDEELQQIVSTSHWTREFNKIRSVQSKSITSKVSNPKRSGSHFTTQQAILNYIKFALEFIRESAATDARRSVAQLNDSILLGLKRQRLPLEQTAAKVASAVDVFAPSTEAGSRVLLYTSDTQKMRTRIKLSPYPEQRIPSRLPREFDPAFEMDPSIQQTEKGILINAGPKNYSRSGMEFAFYLLLNGDRIKTKWFGSQQFMEFKVGEANGDYSAKVFARPINNAKVQYQYDTGVLQIRRSTD